MFNNYKIWVIGVFYMFALVFHHLRMWPINYCVDLSRTCVYHVAVEGYHKGCVCGACYGPMCLPALCISFVMSLWKHVFVCSGIITYNAFGKCMVEACYVWSTDCLVYVLCFVFVAPYGQVPLPVMHLV